MHSQEKTSIAEESSSDSDDDNDSLRYGGISTYEAAAMKKRKENLKRIKELGIYKYPLVCTYVYIYFYTHHVYLQLSLV